MYNLMMAEGAAANCGMIMNPFVATLPSQSSDSDPTAGNPAPQQLLAPYYLAAAGATPSGGLGSSSVYSPYAQWPYLATPGGFLPQQFGGPGGSFAYGAYPMMAESQGFMGAFGSPMGGIDLGVPPCGDQHGPEGCNLFVFHIPNDMTHMDLYLLFRPYGNILSSRIMVDRTTCRSRGFGFVSYDNPASAQEAIRAMNGYQIGHKRLKVQHKRERERGVSSSSSDRGGSGRGRRRSAPAVTQGGSPHSPNALDKPEHTTALASHLAALEFGSAKNVSDSEGAQQVSTEGLTAASNPMPWYIFIVFLIFLPHRQNVAPIASVAASLKVSPTPYGSKHSSKHGEDVACNLNRKGCAHPGQLESLTRLLCSPGSPNPVHACTEYKDQRLGMSKEVMA
jgi:hypothetical protein